MNRADFIQLMGQLHQLVCDISNDSRFSPDVREDIQRKAHDVADSAYNDFAKLFR